ncbi:MAG: prepilin peptidase [Aeromicrobium sp.]
MTMEAWALAALGAGAVGAVGPLAIARLPASEDAGPETPSYGTIASVRYLSAWLAACAVVSVGLVSLAAPALLLPAWALVCGVGSWLAYIDGRTQLLPTRIVQPLLVVALVVVSLEAWLANDVRMFVRAVVTSVVAYAVFWLFWWFGERWRSGGFGFGDVRFAAPLGLVLGSVGGWAAPVGLYLGILIGGVVGVALKSRGRDRAFALGPWMFVGAVLGPVVALAF